MLATASNVELLASVTPVGDLDYYQFNAATGDRIWAYAYTLGATGGTDSQITLQDTSPTPNVIQFDDDNGNQAALSSAIAGAPIAATGAYHAKVNEFQDNGTIVPYTLFLDRTSGAPYPRSSRTTPSVRQTRSSSAQSPRAISLQPPMSIRSASRWLPAIGW